MKKTELAQVISGIKVGEKVQFTSDIGVIQMSVRKGDVVTTRVVDTGSIMHAMCDILAAELAEMLAQIRREPPDLDEGED